MTTANLTSIGGPADQRVIDGLVQEIDIRTGRVLFQWNSAAHVPYADSYVPRPSSPSTPWDWFHINAVHLDTDGNLLVSSRNTWTIFKVNRHTGQIMWQLGGKHSPSPCTPPVAKSSTTRGKSSLGSTTRRRSAAATTRSSTTSPAPTCSAPAEW